MRISAWLRTQPTPCECRGDVLAAKIGGATRTDADVLAATDAMATANAIDAYEAYYTNWKGQFLTPLAQ